MLSKNMRGDLGDAVKSGPATPFRITVNDHPCMTAVQNPAQSTIVYLAGLSGRRCRIFQNGREVTGQDRVWLADGDVFRVEERKDDGQ